MYEPYGKGSSESILAYLGHSRRGHANSCPHLRIAETPIFIEMSARRGYRFIAPVDGCSPVGEIGIAAAPKRSENKIGMSLISIEFTCADSTYLRRNSKLNPIVFQATHAYHDQP